LSDGAFQKGKVRPLKIISIVGARPQFIKAAAISKKLQGKHEEFLLHTGQHYDYEMSGIFFEGLDLPRPAASLGVGSGSHGAQTGAMLEAIEGVLLKERPNYVLIYGDTNSTLAGALAAAKLSVPIAHVEAGLRSYNRRMPEEINRVVADDLSDLLLCPSENAVRNLAVEGKRHNVHLVGDVMLDVLNWAKQRIQESGPAILERIGVGRGNYLLATVHRSQNTDDAGPLLNILKAFNAIDETIIFPVHPRARKAMKQIGYRPEPHVRLIDPVGYLDMVALLGAARLTLTDSGGLQKEAYWLGTPCVTLRDETEWVETVEAGWNVLVGSDHARILEAVCSFNPSVARPPLYGDGAAAEKCVNLLGIDREPLNLSERTEYATWSR